LEKIKEYFKNRTCHVASLHEKHLAIAPVFASILGLNTEPFPINTDLLGTFTKEVERSLSPMLCAKEKCLMAIDALSLHGQADIVIGSEASFGPHPYLPFSAAGHEILYFIDTKNHFELSIQELFLKTNFAFDLFDDFSLLNKAVENWGFPSHALIVKAHQPKEQNTIFKGISTLDALYDAFIQSKSLSFDQKVSVETDMRAHKNPTRMETIRELATKFAIRIKNFCPSCHTPGFGIIETKKGLPCDECSFPTDLNLSLLFGCAKCTYQEDREREDQKRSADPRYCPMCNP